jgi:RimJ/RimL family protein N-acetyltransferase
MQFVTDKAEIVVRQSRAADFDACFALYEAVAAERRWIGGEPPVDRNQAKQRFDSRLDSGNGVTFLAEMSGRLLGFLGVGLDYGVAHLGMMVDEQWRGHGVGSVLMAACIAWAPEHGAHKIALEVWPHNTAAIALYRKYGFVEEARLRRHHRRRNGELWDAIEMGLVLDWDSPSNPYDT